MRLLLDTGVLGQICHPRRHADVRAWFRHAVVAHTLLVSELADYELRRELLRIGSVRSIARLDELARELHYVTVSTTAWRSASALWARARNSGNMGAPPEALDGDVLLAAQALEEDAGVVTTNVKHFDALGVEAYAWGAVPVG
ncbi:PIN domain-containing protein [Pendulispora rubella]|uniref:PIN domain-containing protein n=1 Tax=Pendulispora rubella TaxID=2741070 RepID=A0ABZ2L103_9BACT